MGGEGIYEFTNLRMYEGIIRSHFAIDEEGRVGSFKFKVKPEKTADLALRLVQL